MMSTTESTPSALARFVSVMSLVLPAVAHQPGVTLAHRATYDIMAAGALLAVGVAIAIVCLAVSIVYGAESR